MLAKDFVDKEVIGRGGTRIGKVEDLAIDTIAWRVTALHVKLEGSVADELHLKKRFGSPQLPVGIEHVQGVGDTIVLRSTEEELIRSMGPLKEGGQPSSARTADTPTTTTP